MADPIPVILCGKTEQIGKSVIEGLKPEIEVVHFVLTPEAGIKEIPQIMQGTMPDNPGSTIGSGNLKSGVKAVVLGGAYDPDATSSMREAVATASQVPWFSQDPDIPTPPLGPEYGKAMVQRVRKTLTKMNAEGKLYVGNDATYQY